MSREKEQVREVPQINCRVLQNEFYAEKEMEILVHRTANLKGRNQDPGMACDILDSSMN